MRIKALLVAAILFVVTPSAFAGEIVAWGESTWELNVPPAGDDFIAVSAGSYTNLGLKSDGSVVVWGATGNPPFSVPAEQGFIAISLGYTHVLAIRGDGSLAGWGNNVYGQSDVPAGNNFIAVAAGNWHSLALRDNGSIESFGDNYYGQLDVPEPNDFIAIAAGHDSSLAIRSNGSLVAWGWNHDGIVTDLPAESNFVSIAVGTYGVALRDNGTLVNWGTSYVVPAGNDFVAIEAGKYHSLALRADGSLVGWGSNGVGQCDSPAIPAGYVFTDFAAGNHGNSVGLIEFFPRTLTMVIEPNDAGIDTVAPNSGSYNSTVNLTATTFIDCPYVYKFNHWDGDVANVNAANTTVFMDSDKTVTAVFTATRECGDECHPNDLLGDFNHDCIIDIADFAEFALNWMVCTKPECD